jgi:hypothetical protein
MAANAKREPRALKRWLLKVRESWRRSSAISARASAAHRADEAKGTERLYECDKPDTD